MRRISRRAWAWRFAAVASLALWIAPAAAETLTLTTWNLNWLTIRNPRAADLPSDVVPRVPGDFNRLARYAAALHADVVALEEVDGPATAARLFPPDAYALHFTADRVTQRVGFAIRRGIAFTANPDLTALDVYPPDARFQLRSGADITLHLAGGVDLRILAVHLKTGCWDDPLTRSRRPACRTLAEQVPVLQRWIEARKAEGTPFVVMGDFNRRMVGGDQLLAALEAAGPLRLADAGLDEDCWEQGPFIDHILAGGPARAWLQPQTLTVLRYSERDPAMKEHLSDHCPVSVRMNLP